MKNKKLISVFLTLTVLALVLTASGCGKKQKQEEEKTSSEEGFADFFDNSEEGFWESYEEYTFIEVPIEE